MATPETDKLKRTRWYKPTRERYAAHIAACNVYGMEPEPFERFAYEVLSTDEKLRDWLLKVEPIENVGPFLRYAQYEAPRGAEMFYGTQRRK